MHISETLEPFLYLNDLPLVLKKFREAGFDAYDFSFCLKRYKNQIFIYNRNYVQRALKFRKLADSLNIVCNQAHAPFPVFNYPDPKENDRMFKLLIRSIHAASILGAKVIVVHPANNLRYKDNIIFYKRLIPYAKKYNIKIGIENMWNHQDGKIVEAACSFLDDYLNTISFLDENYFTCCVDIGHAEMFYKDYSNELLRGLNKYVGALHIHDNEDSKDNHWSPGEGKIDFVKIYQSLKDIEYKGDITLEVLYGKNRSLDINDIPHLAKIASLMRKQLTR